jgi:hypothetical protein
VNYEATAYVNGQEVGTHFGGYQSFTFDITQSLKADRNDLTVKVHDPVSSATDPYPRGKAGTQYTGSSGIWQTVWLETVPETYIENLRMTPDVDHSQLHLEVGLKGSADGYTVQAIAKNGATVVANQTVKGQTALVIPNPRLWSPDDPHLYDLNVRLLKGGRVADEVTSYFGLRKIEVKKDMAGVDRIFLNGRYTFNLGVLDQGFWPDGIYTAPTDAALRFDVQAIKAMGFNTIRKHIKIEPDRWYYHCDQLGILVWQDMVPPANTTVAGRAEFEREVEANLAQLHNHPSITTWVLFNEGWGAYDQERLARWIKRLDPSRLLNGHSGPINYVQISQAMRQMDPAELVKTMNDLEAMGALMVSWSDSSSENWIASDLTDFHHYPDPKMPPAEPGKARVVGENGGIGVFVENHVWNDIPGAGYVQVGPAQFGQAYAGIVQTLTALEARGLSGSIFTQPYDIEDEQNGLMTYDREVIKAPLAEIARINGQLVSRTKNADDAARHLSIADVDTTLEPQRYAGLVSRYEQGDTTPTFLRHFALMAVRQKDQSHSTAAGNEYLALQSKPYSEDTLRFIIAVTQSSKDSGFEVLRADAERIDNLVGSSAAEARAREVIAREEIDPYLTKASEPDWRDLERRLTEKYGALGAEAVYWKAMFFYWRQRDFTRFGHYYALYFATAAGRSEYATDNLSYRVFEHVSDPAVLAEAVKAVQSSLGNSQSEDAVQIDTYANLLYKTGHTTEALEWQRKAAAIGQGRLAEIDEHLRRMKVGLPTWPST